jgi:hypothetical protein
MTFSDLQTFIAALVNDPNHDRYTLSDINTELDNTQNKWNLAAKIIKDTITLTVVDGTRQYALSSLTGTPISFERVTHRGILLEKRSKAWFDLYAGGTDWTTTPGTPTAYFIEGEDPAVQYITLFPIPQSGDAGAYLVVEYVKQHTSMSAASDVPFMSGTETNYLLRPYDSGLGFDVAYRLLLRDPSSSNAKKSQDYLMVATNVLTEVVQVFKALEAQEPKRIVGGRYWNSGYTQLAK